MPRAFIHQSATADHIFSVHDPPEWPFNELRIHCTNAARSQVGRQRGQGSVQNLSHI